MREGPQLRNGFLSRTCADSPGTNKDPVHESPSFCGLDSKRNLGHTACHTQSGPRLLRPHRQRPLLRGNTSRVVKGGDRDRARRECKPQSRLGGSQQGDNKDDGAPHLRGSVRVLSRCGWPGMWALQHGPRKIALHASDSAAMPGPNPPSLTGQ